jgi:hypothetical protein
VAQKVRIELVDDLDGSEASQTLTFGLDGTMYEIDLSEKNAESFRQTFGVYAKAGRRQKQRRRTRTKV